MSLTRRIAIALIAVTFPLSAQKAKDQSATIDAYIAKGMTDWHIPGLSIAIVKDGAVVYVKGHGVRERGKPATVDTRTLFGMMSTTKAITAMAIAILVDEGKLGWKDPVTKWLPTFTLQDPWMQRELTVEDLLTHNAGLPNADLLWGRGDLSLDEILRRVRYLAPAYSMRSGFIYNNVAYGAAGAVVAAASGMSWEDFVERRIFRPAGMTRSYATLAHMKAANDANVSAAHWEFDDGRITTVREVEVDPVPAAGAAWSTAEDVATYLRFLLDSTKVNGTRVVSDSNFRRLFAPHAFVGLDEFYPTAKLTQPHWMTYGLGWFQQDYRGMMVQMHTGSIDGRTAITALVPDSRLGVYIFGNLDHAEFRHALMWKVIDLYTGGPSRDWSAEFLTLYGDATKRAREARAAAEQRRVAGTSPSLALSAYAGRYTHPAWGDLVIALDGSTLRATLGIGPENTGTLTHWNYDTFRAVFGDGRSGSSALRFTLDPRGRVESVDVDGSADYRFTRVP
ncbi:MAG: serine hydrolase [Gemmatimonadaceae bacterium]|nr:serine hydrolase [Gemmatimonadaceae bacterium]